MFGRRDQRVGRRGAEDGVVAARVQVAEQVVARVAAAVVGGGLAANEGLGAGGRVAVAVHVLVQLHGHAVDAVGRRFVLHAVAVGVIPHVVAVAGAAEAHCRAGVVVGAHARVAGLKAAVGAAQRVGFHQRFIGRRVDLRIVGQRAAGRALHGGGDGDGLGAGACSQGRRAARAGAGDVLAAGRAAPVGAAGAHVGQAHGQPVFDHNRRLRRRRAVVAGHEAEGHGAAGHVRAAAGHALGDFQVNVGTYRDGSTGIVVGAHTGIAGFVATIGGAQGDAFRHGFIGRRNDLCVVGQGAVGPGIHGGSDHDGTRTAARQQVSPGSGAGDVLTVGATRPLARDRAGRADVGEPSRKFVFDDHSALGRGRAVVGDRQAKSHGASRGVRADATGQVLGNGQVHGCGGVEALIGVNVVLTSHQGGDM